MWTIEPGHSGTKFSIKSEERDEHGPYTEVIAMVHAPDNALLIAAAPDMLAVLSLLVHGDGHPDEMPRIMAAARAALAKAEGK